MNNFKAPHVSKSIVKQVLAGSAVAVALLVAGGNAVNADTTSANVTNPTPTTQTPTTQTTDNQASQAKAATITVNFKDGDKVVKTIKVDVKDVNNADDLNQANDSIKSQLPDNYKLADGVAVNTNATDTNMDVAVTSTAPAETDTNKATDNDKQKGSIYHLTPAEMQAAKESAKKDGVTVNEDGVAYDGNTDGMPNPYAPKTDITTGTPAKGANVTPDGQILTQVDPLAPISGDDSSNIPSSIDLSATKDMPWNDTMSALDNPNGNPYNTDLNATGDTTGNQTNSALPDTGQNTKNSGVIAAVGAGLVAIAGLFGLARSRKTVK